MRYPVVNLRRMGGLLEDYQAENQAFKEKLSRMNAEAAAQYAAAHPGPVYHPPMFPPAPPLPPPPPPPPPPSGGATYFGPRPGPMVATGQPKPPDPNVIYPIVPPAPPPPPEPTYPGVVTGYPTKPPEGPPPPYKPGPLPTQTGPVATPGGGTPRESTIPVCRSCGLNSGFQMISDLDIRNMGINPASCRAYPDSYCNPEPPFEGEPTEMPPTYEPVPSFDRYIPPDEPTPVPTPATQSMVPTGGVNSTPSWNTAPGTTRPPGTPGVASIDCGPGKFWDGRQCRGSVGSMPTIPGGMTSSAVQATAFNYGGGGMTAASSFMGQVPLRAHPSQLGAPRLTMLRVVGY